MKFSRILISLILISLTACEKERNLPELKDDFSPGGLFIVNEGNLGYGNASLSYYEIDSMIISNSIFSKINGFPVGDALQSLNIKDSLGFLCVSNSGKIIVFNINSFHHVTTIGGFTAPRYIEFLPGNIAVVSDLYSEELSFIDLEGFSISSRMNLGGSSEQMLVAGNFLYVISWSFNNKIYKINPEEYKVVDSLITGVQPNSFVLDREGFLWVLSDGGYEGNPFGHERAGLTKINLDDFSVVMHLDFHDINSSPTELHLGPEGDDLFFIDSGAGNQDDNKGLFIMSVTDTELPARPFIEEGTRLIYGLGVDPENGDIYISDAKDYLRKGTIYRYNSEGKEIDRFEAGIIPGEFIFVD